MASTHEWDADQRGGAVRSPDKGEFAVAATLTGAAAAIAFAVYSDPLPAFCIAGLTLLLALASLVKPGLGNTVTVVLVGVWVGIAIADIRAVPVALVICNVAFFTNMQSLRLMDRRHVGRSLGIAILVAIAAFALWAPLAGS